MGFQLLALGLSLLPRMGPVHRHQLSRGVATPSRRLHGGIFKAGALGRENSCSQGEGDPSTELSISIRQQGVLESKCGPLKTL